MSNRFASVGLELTGNNFQRIEPSGRSRVINKRFPTNVNRIITSNREARFDERKKTNSRQLERLFRASSFALFFRLLRAVNEVRPGLIALIRSFLVRKFMRNWNDWYLATCRWRVKQPRINISCYGLFREQFMSWMVMRLALNDPRDFLRDSQFNTFAQIDRFDVSTCIHHFHLFAFIWTNWEIPGEP